MTNIGGHQEDVTVWEMLDKMILQPAAGDVTLSAATEDETGQRSAGRPRGSCSSERSFLKTLEMKKLLC